MGLMSLAICCLEPRTVLRYTGEYWALPSLLQAPGMKYQSTIMRAACCSVRSGKKSSPNTLPRWTCSWGRRAETILWVCQGWKRWNLGERTIVFSLGQHSGEIDVGFPDLNGTQRIIIGEADNIHDLAARDTRWINVLEQSESQLLVPFGMLAASFNSLGSPFLVINSDEAVRILLSDVPHVR